MDLTTRLGGLTLANPVIAASGTCGAGVELARAADVREFGAIVLKTVTIEPREGNPPARLAETPSGLLNSIGLENPGVERFCERQLPGARGLGVPLVVSIAGRSPADYAACARAFDEASRQAAGIVAVEVNLSCPNDRPEGGSMTPLAFGQDAAAAAEVVSAVREATALPVWAKLTACVADIACIGHACAAAGADAIVAINTLPGMAVDVRRRRPVLGASTGGLSGPAILPVALKCARELSVALDVPVIGCGGASSAEDVAAFLMVGAAAVEVGTATLRDPAAGPRLARELGALGDELGFASVGGMIGSLRT